MKSVLTGEELWPHQAEEIPALLNGHRLLAWEPGTGKTLGALEAFNKLAAEAALGGTRARALVIVPANVRTQWLCVSQELGFETQLIEKTTDKVSPDAEIVIVSYHGIISKTVWLSAMALSWDVLILDEAHYCKTPSTKWTKAIFGAKKNTPAALIGKASRVWCLTGTPMTKDPTDLWVLVSRLFPDAAGEIKTKSEWQGEFCLGYNTPYGFRVTGARKPEELHARLKPFMSRIKKKDVLAGRKEPLFDRFRFPARKIEITNEVSEELRSFLERFEKADDDTDIITLTEGLEPQVATLRRAIGLSKAHEIAEYIKEDLSELPDTKALLFFQHIDVGKRLAEALALAGIDAVYVDGSVPVSKRDARKKRFREIPEVRVFIGQIQATGTGTDGLQVASRVYVAEEPWTFGVLEQAVSRADRGGQKNQVHVTSFVIAGSYDDRVSRALENRRRMIDRIIEGEAA